MPTGSMISEGYKEMSGTKTSMSLSSGLGAPERRALDPVGPKSPLTASLILEDETCCIKTVKLILTYIFEFRTSERING